MKTIIPKLVVLAMNRKKKKLQISIKDIELLCHIEDVDFKTICTQTKEVPNAENGTVKSLDEKCAMSLIDGSVKDIFATKFCPSSLFQFIDKNGERAVVPSIDLSICFEDGDEKIAAKILSRDLKIFKKCFNILGYSKSPKIVDIASLNGKNNPKALFCSIFINTNEKIITRKKETNYKQDLIEYLKAYSVNSVAPEGSIGLIISEPEFIEK